MSREIKFRAWDDDNECMQYSDLSFFNIESLIQSLDSFYGYFYREYFEDNPKNLMQYTGLKDKNGKEIYEGDIVYSDNWNPSKQVVVFNNGAFCLDWGDSDYYNDIYYAEKMEIIGNIHENKELL